MAKPIALLLLAAVKSAQASGSLSFLALGDWGGDSDATPVNQAESCVATGMGTVASSLQAEFVLALGDNFYSGGITTKNENRFQSTFENVFTSSSLQVDWWAIGGNHDHDGDVDLQVEYSQKSHRWKFPSRYYTFNKTLPSGKVAEFVMFDSVDLVGPSYQNETSLEFVKATGPKHAQLAADQWSWIESSLAASKADYLFTACHYPVWSGCSHGPTDELVSKLKPMLKKYGVTAHLAGHDHCLQHIEEDGIYYINSGAGSLGWYDLVSKSKLGPDVDLKWYMIQDNANGQKSGFAAVTLDDNGAVVRYYGNDGQMQYTSAPQPPRTTAIDITV